MIGVLADDRVGVMRAVMVDVVDRLIKPRDHADGEHRIQIFGSPVFLARGLGFGEQRAGLRAAAQGHARLGEGRAERRQ